MARTLLEALSALNDIPFKVAQGEFYIWTKRGNPKAYLSGVPYLWSNYSDRAFIFASREQAQALIEEFPKELRGASVGVWLVGKPGDS